MHTFMLCLTPRDGFYWPAVQPEYVEFYKLPVISVTVQVESFCFKAMVHTFALAH